MTAACSGSRGATYLDFEGNVGLKPTVLGVLWFSPDSGPQFEQFVFERVFDGAARAGNCTVASLQDVIERITSVAEASDCEIVAWSSTELDIVTRWTPELARRFGLRFRDARVDAKSWLFRVHPDVVPPRTDRNGRHTLDFYRRITGYYLSTMHRSGSTGRRLSSIRAQLQRKDGDFGRLTRVCKAHWTISSAEMRTTVAGYSMWTRLCRPMRPRRLCGIRNAGDVRLR
jgi:hypothetical protein